jgi:NAD(P)-dependent dehydrogenase (short-subunit alcohol dehydrogenase family)
MPQPISHKAWFITGASKGFGYVWTEAALARGDSVAAAARNVGMLDTLKVKLRQPAPTSQARRREQERGRSGVEASAQAARAHRRRDQ